MPRPRPLVSVLASLLLVPSLALGQPRPEGKPTPFTSQVESHFGEWDRNHDGTLQPDEIDALVVDPHITREAAAALASLKITIRAGKVELPPLTLEYFHTYESELASRPRTPTAPAAHPSPAAPPAVNFERAYSRGLRRITSTKRDLFADGTPSLETCHQGPLGDCFFVSVVGAALVRSEADIRGLIVPDPTGTPDAPGGYTVTFPGSRPVHIAPLTDAEIALTSTTGNDGLWLAVLEKAYGSIRNETLPEERQTESATDAISRGGSTTSTIRLLTGHTANRCSLRPRPPHQARGGRSSPRPEPTPEVKPDGPAPADGDHANRGAPQPHPGDPPAPTGRGSTPPARPAVDPEALAKYHETLLPKLRTQLTEAMEHHRLAAAGTAKDDPMPPGINASHAYAILGYDAAADTIHLWNPHGNTFRPRGEAGLEHGYPTKAGHFEMPLAEFAKVFNGVAIETETVARKS